MVIRANAFFINGMEAADVLPVMTEINTLAYLILAKKKSAITHPNHVSYKFCLELFTCIMYNVHFSHKFLNRITGSVTVSSYTRRKPHDQVPS